MKLGIIITTALLFFHCIEIGNLPNPNINNEKDELLNKAKSLQDTTFIKAVFKKPQTINQFIDFLKEDPKVLSATLNNVGNAVTIQYSNFRLGHILLLPNIDQINVPQISLPKLEPSKRIKKAVLITPNIGVWSGNISQLFVNKVKNQINKYFTCDHIIQENETIDQYKALRDYRLVYLITHGFHSGSTYFFLTSIPEFTVNLTGNDINYFEPVTVTMWEELKDLNIANLFMQDKYRTKLAIRTDFFNAGEGGLWFDSSLVIFNTCHSLKRTYTAEILLKKGARVICGWDTFSTSPKLNKFNEQVFIPLLEGSSGKVLADFSVDRFKYKLASDLTPNTYYLFSSTLLPPTNVSTIAGDCKVMVTWQSSAPTHNIYWSKSPGITKANAKKILNVSSPYTHESLQNDIPYYYKVTSVNANIESNLSKEVNATPKKLSPKMLAYMNFNEGSGTTVNDLTGNGYNGTIYGSTPLWVDGIEGSALKLNGIDNYVSVTKDLTLADNFTIKFNIKFEEVIKTSRYILTKHKTHDNFDCGWSMFMNYSDSLPVDYFFFINTPAGTNNYREIQVKQTPYKLNYWHEMKLTFDDINNKYNVYLDSKLIRSDTLSIEIRSNPHPFYIGAAYSGFPEAFSQFTIDELKIYETIE